MRKAFVLFSVLLLLCCFYVQSSAYTRGDIDLDGNITASDAREVLRLSVGLSTADGEALFRCDADGNGKINSSDARCVLRFAVKLPSEMDFSEDKGFAGIGEAIVSLTDIYTYEEMLDDLSQLSEIMPSRFIYWSQGTTADGREIICCRIGSGFGKNQIVAEAGIHGSEYLNPAAVMSVIEYYLKNYDTPVFNSQTVREVLCDTDIYFFPMLNPDGIAISQQGLSGLRSEKLASDIKRIYNENYSKGITRQSLSVYLSEWKANARGVDINRNFMSQNNGVLYQTGIFAPANENYAGEYMFSEAESIAYKEIIEKLGNIVAVLSIHSQGRLIYWDCQQSQQGKAQAKTLAQLVSRHTGYYLDMSDSFVGASADWTMIEKGIPSVTVECGRGHNPLSLSQQADISREIRDIFLSAAVFYANYTA